MIDATSANRALWDEWADLHIASAFYDLESFKRGGIRLRAFEVHEVGPVSGRSLLHLQCHFGIDTLSWARLGARVTGVDFSPRAVALAQSLAAELRLPARFICADVLELPAILDERFAIVYTSRGILSWLPDLSRWAQVVARSLQPGGVFYITEAHPIIQVWDDDEGIAGLRFRYPYFASSNPVVVPTHGSYADRDAHVVQPVSYQWAHDLGEIVTALTSSGLRIEFLHEFPFIFYQALPFLEQHEDRTWWLPSGWRGELPLSFSLRATKPGEAGN